MKKLLAAVALLLVALLLVQRFRSVTGPHTDTGDQARLVSLAPNLTEIIFALGLGNQVVGVTSYCIYPPETAQIEKVGDFIHPNLENIVNLAPDLVVAEHSASSKTASRLRSLGVKVVEVDSPRSLSDVYVLIRRVGEALEEPEAARHLVERMRRRARRIERRAAQLPRRPSLYLEIDPPSWTVGRGSFITEAIQLAGARNIFEDVNRPALQVSKEMVIARDPEIIVSLDAVADEIRARPGWGAIRAVRENKIIDDVDRNLLSHGSQRLMPGMEQLQNRLERLLSEEKAR